MDFRMFRSIRDRAADIEANEGLEKKSLQTARKVYEQLGSEPKSLEEIAQGAEISPETAKQIIHALQHELKGVKEVKDYNSKNRVSETGRPKHKYKVED